MEDGRLFYLLDERCIQVGWRVYGVLLILTLCVPSVATWEISSSILAIGLSWKDAIPIILVGYMIVCPSSNDLSHGGDGSLTRHGRQWWLLF
jgi:cytosine/uracil/thiamine/allantoin permease